MSVLTIATMIFGSQLLLGASGDGADGGIAPVAAENPHRYGIYTATVDGKEVKRILSDPRREINHARVSPDGEWITFTRYTRDVDGDGFCEEVKDGYNGTEIMVCRVDGSDLQTALPAEEGHINANSYWLPDSKRIITVSGALGAWGTGVAIVDVGTNKRTPIPTPGLIGGDPHYVNGRIVFSGLKQGEARMCLWMMNADGSDLMRLTDPKTDEPWTKQPFPGDYDSKWSPDGTRVAFMRHMKYAVWHLIVVDVETGEETDLSPADVESPYADSVPEWSPDGNKLVFWHASLPPEKIGVYAVAPDGANRRKLPLDTGYGNSFPVYFPNDANRLMYSVIQREPGEQP